MPSSLRSLAVAVLVAAAAPAVCAAAATASSITASSFLEQRERGPPDELTRIVWTADPGERNRVHATTDDAGVVVRDAAGPIRAGAGCTARPDGSAVCAVPHYDRGIRLEAGDGDDEIRTDFGIFFVEQFGGAGDDVLVSAGTANRGTVLDGGPGEDAITGGPSDDRIAGGAGADLIDAGAGMDTIVDDPAEGPFSRDVIDGGDGRPRYDGVIEAHDTVDYARTSPVHVDLAAGTGGGPGEGDVLRGVENVSGGAADDVLLGDEGPNALNGLIPSVPGFENVPDGGEDRLEGRGGGDELRIGRAGGHAVLLGGDGDDDIDANGSAEVDGGAGRDAIGAWRGTIRCGADEDRLTSVSQRALVAADCEQMTLADASISALAVHPRIARLVVSAYGVNRPRCGVRLTLREAASGRLLARRLLRLRGVSVEWRVRLPLAVAAPVAPIRVVAQYAVCRRGRAPRVGRPIPSDGFLFAPGSTTSGA